MLLNRAVGVGSLAVVGMALALAPAQSANAQRASRAAATPGSVSTPGQPGQAVLLQRKPLPRIPTAQLQVPVDATGSIIVKFNDDVRARIQAGVINSENNINIAQALAVMNQFGLTAKPALPWAPDRLARLEAKASANSGKAQPDLAGIIEFTGPANNLLAAAKAFNDLPSVEWVDFRRQWTIDPGPGADERCCLLDGQCIFTTEATCLGIAFPLGPGLPGGPGSTCDDGDCGPGPCCLPDGTCMDGVDDEVACMVLGGIYQGFGFDCELDEIECDTIQCGMVPDDCFSTHSGPACSDQDCCTLVCMLKASCCELSWDTDCAALANLHCITPPPPNGPDRCAATQFNGDCFEVHQTGGCLDSACCNLVCDVNPFCCDAVPDAFWDDSCVATALLVCVTTTPDIPTPLFTATQGYLRRNSYIGQAGGAPGNLAFPPSLPGFGGEGWNLHGRNYALWVINEINASVDPILGDANGDGLVSLIQDEFVEIVNNFDIDVNIAGWTLSDADSVRHTFPAGTVIKAAEAVVVFGGGIPNGSFGGATVQTASTGQLNLNDAGGGGGSGDTVTLTNADGVVVTSYTYGAEADNGYSITRVPDVSGTETTGLIPLPCAVGADCVGGVCIAGGCPGDYSPGTRADGSVFTDTFEGLYGLSRELFETYGIGETSPPGSTDYGDLRYNARGKGIKVAVIEWAFYEDHEDLDVISEPGLTLLLLPATGPGHATACLGIINGIENSFGVTGIAPESQAYFFPLTSVETGPREQAAFLSAYETLDAGDVVSCSFSAFGNLNTDMETWTLIRLGSDIGITTCVSGGNDCANLTQSTPNFGDSGAVVVGAGQGGFPYCRLGFSNYFNNGVNTDGNVVHLQAWGEGVTTCGHDGSLFNPLNDPNRRYSNRFNGTSSAAPQIAGLIACLQGFARQFYGIHLQPEIIRQVAANGINQCQFDDPDDLFGTPPGFPCSPDFDPDSGPNKIGVYPIPTASAAVILTQSNVGFDDSPLVDGITILTGQLIQGNVFSIKGSDDNYLIIESRITSPSDSGGSSHGGLASGQITDVLIEAHMSGPMTQSIDLTVEAHVDGGSGIELVYLFDWQLNMWLAVGVDFLDIVDPIDPTIFEIENAARFIRASDRKVLIRVWTVALGISGQYRMYNDWVNIERGGGGAFLSGGGP